MKKTLLLALVLTVLGLPARAQQPANGGPIPQSTYTTLPQGVGIPMSTVATLPPNASVGTVYQVSDSSAPGNCLVGGGTSLSLCRQTLTGYVAIGDGGAGGIPALNQIYVSKVCGGQANCFTVANYGFDVTDPVFAAASTTVTTGGGDPAFVCPNASFPCTNATSGCATPSSSCSVGMAEFGTSGCLSVSEASCLHNVPQGTITTVTNAHSVVVSIAAANISSATANSNHFIWGIDDGAQMAAATTALTLAAQTAPVSMMLPGGIIMVGQSPLVTGTHMIYPIQIKGQNTEIITLPRMNCPGTSISSACVIFTSFTNNALGGIGLSDLIEGVWVWGGGIDVPEGTAVYGTFPNAITCSFFCGMHNVGVTGWNWNRAVGSKTFGIVCIGCTATNVVSYAGGNYSCYLSANSSVPVSWHGGSCGGSQYNSVTAGGGNVDMFSPYINASISNSFTQKTSYGVYSNTGNFTMHGGTVGSGIWVDTGGTQTYFGTNISGTGGDLDFNLAGGALNLYGTHLDANANITGGVLTHDALVTWPPPTGLTKTGGTIQHFKTLSASCTGVATPATTLGLYGSGPNVTLTTCTSAAIGSGVVQDHAGTIATLEVTSTAAGTSGSSGVVTVLKNGGATAVTCTFGTTTACNDYTHSASFAVGDLISINFTTQAAETLAGLKAIVSIY